MSYFSEVMADSPAGYWRMDDSSGFPQDSSGNNNDVNEDFGSALSYLQTGAILSDPTSTSIFSSAFDIRAADHATLDLGNVFTLEVWIRRNAIGATDFLVSKGVGAYGLKFDSTNVLTLTRFATADIVSSTITITDTSSFHHCVATKSGATSVLYIDSVNVTGSVSDSTMVNNTTSLGFGSSGADGGGDSQVNGWMDEIAVYPTALSAARVLAHYEAATETAGGPGDNPPIGILGRGAGW